MSEVKPLVKAFHAEQVVPNREVAKFKILDDRSYVRDERPGQYKIVKAYDYVKQQIHYFFGYAEKPTAFEISYEVIRTGLPLDSTYAQTFFK